MKQPFSRPGKSNPYVFPFTLSLVCFRELNTYTSELVEFNYYMSERSNVPRPAIAIVRATGYVRIRTVGRSDGKMGGHGRPLTRDSLVSSAHTPLLFPHLKSLSSHTFLRCSSLAAVSLQRTFYCTEVCKK